MGKSRKVSKPRRSPCCVAEVGKRRDGGTRYWCLQHKADATAKYGVKAEKCRYYDVPPIAESDAISLDIGKYKGGLSLWGAVPPVYDTTSFALDKGVHVHARLHSNGDKVIDRTFRQVKVVHSGDSWVVDELDAIYYMTASVFGFSVRSVCCSRCGHEHLDKDWFSVHPHQSHLCAGCGRYFKDDAIAIGNPVSKIQQQAFAKKARFRPAKKSISIKQSDFSGGIQLWGSNPAILWTSNKHQETGIHIHAFLEGCPEPVIDDTFSSVEIDGITLDEEQLRTYMAQKALPHISDRIRVIHCASCNAPQFDRAELSFSPVVRRVCQACGKPVSPKGRQRKVVANPIIEKLDQLSRHAVRRPQSHDPGLLPETL